MGDKLFIFDIDSALDKLEDDLINNEVKSKINSHTSKSQQQNENEGKEISVKVNDESISVNELSENNGNTSSTNESLSEVILDNSTQTQSKVVLSSQNNTENDDSQIHTEARSDFVENGQTMSAADDKITSSAMEMNSSSSSDSSSEGESSSGECESSDEDIKDEEIKRPDQIPMISEESTSKYRDINLASNDDSSKQLINSDESNLNEEVEEEDDLNVTTDLTLTKTVEPTEYDPEPEINQLEEKPIEQAIPVVQVEKAEEIIQEDPIKVVYEKIIEERFDIKEISHNFESTMDDISDAELESLEQELDDLIAAAAENSERLSEENEIKSLEESFERTVEVSSGNLSEKKIEEVKKVAPLECLEAVKEEVPMEIGSETQKVPEEEKEIEPTSSIVEIEQPESISEAQEAIEPVQETPVIQETSNVDQDAEAAISTSSTDESASIQNLPSQSIEDFSVNESVSTGSLTSQPLLGHVPPHWVPDSSSQQCMQCDQKFTILKRRHHCRACGLLLCAGCCNFKHYLHYAQSESRVCERCCEILKSQLLNNQQDIAQPTPQNPSTYCSTIPVQQQANANQEPPTVMVPTGVLKRTPRNSTERKSVMFSDGIRPGTDLDETLSPNPSLVATTASITPSRENPKLNFPKINEKNNSYVPEATNELPPIFLKDCEFKYVDNNVSLLQRLRQEELKFAINKNFYVIVKIVTLTCCTNKTVINFSTFGLSAVRQDEIMILLELNDDMTGLPNEVFLHLNEIYCKADKNAVVIKEYGHSQASSNNFLGAFGGFLYIRPTFQCLQSLTLPESPYLIGLLVHKWEVPWMRLFPLRLILRLGALYRYYPTPILSNINREPVFAEIGNTIMNFLVDFRNFSYTIEIIKGLNILMEVKKTSVFIPRNRYDQIMKVINNSTDHLLAFGADFSKVADGHLVCIQNIDSSSSESLSYSTQMINIQGQERIRTGASFLILNGALKQSSGLKAKCSIVEDGLMIQIFASKMQSVRDALKNMKNVEIPCGPMDESQKDSQEEILSIEWIDDDLNFNKDVVSPIDNLSFEGKESIRMRFIDITSHNHTKILRWCAVFQLESDEAPVMDDHLNYSKICEPIAKACGNALLPFLDLMANQLRKIGIRVTLGENIKYLAGSNGLVFSPIYMNALDNELIAVIHRQASNMSRDSNITLELIFYILNK